MDAAQRAELRKLTEEATPGPWRWKDGWPRVREMVNHEADAAFIAAAREAVPELLDALDAAEAERDEEFERFRVTSDAVMERALAAEARVETLEAALRALLRFAREVDIQATFVQGGVDVRAALGDVVSGAPAEGLNPDCPVCYSNATSKPSLEQVASTDAQSDEEPSDVRALDISGVCPMGCGRTLFLGAGGHVTCSWRGCPNPSAADEMLTTARPVGEAEGRADKPESDCNCAGRVAGLEAALRAAEADIAVVYEWLRTTTGSGPAPLIIQQRAAAALAGLREPREQASEAPAVEPEP